MRVIDERSKASRLRILSLCLEDFFELLMRVADELVSCYVSGASPRLTRATC